MWYVVASIQGEAAHDLIDGIADNFRQGMRAVFALDAGEATEGLVFGPWYRTVTEIPSEGNYSPRSHRGRRHYVTWDAGYGWLTLYAFDRQAGKD
jgi:hypothetical protein